MFIRILYIICYILSFLILPFIIFITSVIYLITVIKIITQFNSADFFEDIYKYNEISDLSRVALLGSNSYISSYSLTFLIISIIYVFSIIYIIAINYIYLKEANTYSESDCTYFKDASSGTNLFTSVLFFAYVLIIVIIDITTNLNFNSKVGNYKTAFNEKTQTFFAGDYVAYLETKIAKDTPTILDVNSQEELQKYAVEQKINFMHDLPTETKQAFEANVKNNEEYKQHYANIVKAYMTYGILKTIKDNGYNTKRSITIDSTFLSAPVNLFHSVNFHTHQLINLDYSLLNNFLRNPNACSSPTVTTLDTSTPNVLDYVFEECNRNISEIDDILLKIKNEAAGAYPTVIFFLIMTSPLLLISVMSIISSLTGTSFGSSLNFFMNPRA